MENKKIRVGITQGDINGVGCEIIMKTFAQNSKVIDLCTPIVYGSTKTLAYYRNALKLNHITSNAITSMDEVKDNQLNIVNCAPGEVKIDMGQSTIQAGEFSLKALEKAVEDRKNDQYDVMVTAPLNKENLKKVLPTFSGHTEYLQENFDNKEVLMMMVKDKLRIAVATTHIPVSEISNCITADLIERKVKLFNKSLLEDFTIKKGRIAVLGLNPHSGDNGAIGSEDKDIIAPTLQKLRDQGINAYGPYPADGFFGSGEHEKFDAILAMYHDQGLVPFKLIARGGGVNYTAGLPIVRTSPAHGTAYNIAGKNVADPSSFREAIYLGLDIFRNRQRNAEMTTNPLKIEPPRNKRRES